MPKTMEIAAEILRKRTEHIAVLEAANAELKAALEAANENCDRMASLAIDNARDTERIKTALTGAAITAPRYYRAPRRKIADGMFIPPLVRWVWMEMQNQKMTLRQLAARSGINERTINSWVRGASSPRVVDIEAVVNSLGYNLRVSVGEGL